METLKTNGDWELFIEANEIPKVDVQEDLTRNDGVINEQKREAKSLKLRARHMQKKILAKISTLKSCVNGVKSTSTSFLEYYIKDSLSLQLEVMDMINSLQDIERWLEIPLGTYSGELQDTAKVLYWKDIDEYDAALKLLEELKWKYCDDVRNTITMEEKTDHPSQEPADVIEKDDGCLATDMEVGNE